MLAEALIAGINAAGIDALNVGLGPTPMLYYAASTKQVDGGIQITGSHNPPDYNGFKMVFQGRPFFGADIQAIGEMAAAGDWESVDSGSEGTAHGEYKVPGGKLVVVELSIVDGRMTAVQVSGDFFLEPASALDAIDAALEGLPADTGEAALAAAVTATLDRETQRSEEHTSELQSLMRISYAVFCLKK